MGKQQDEIIKKRILDWAGPTFPLEIREEAARAYGEYERGRITEEVDYYMTELRFGTGGLRGVIGNGPGRMNRWTVGRATLGLCRYLKSVYDNPSIVIAHDSRRMSREFALVTAGVAASMGVRVYLFSEVTPTPILSYAIRHQKASGGVVITASHNPPEYNGYKVYLEDGSQLVGDPQTGVESAIDAITNWEEIPFLTPADPLFKKSVVEIADEIRKSYYAEFDRVFFIREGNTSRKTSIVYSPLHGTGGKWLPGLLNKYGFSVTQVDEQAEPDGEFPTVKYPNPEEPEALRLVEQKAVEEKADLFLATDPDADRLGAGFRDREGKYILLNGNQIGSIMCAYLAEKVRGESKSAIRWNILKTIVTTNLQRRIAEKNDIAIRDVLTGFKYIAEQMKFMDDGREGYERGVDRFLFGGEESFGYLPVSFVRDKDSISSALLLALILEEHKDILAYLDQIYLNYGLYLEILKSVTMKGSSGKAKIKEILDRLRSENLIGWVLGERKVVSVLDFANQTKNGQPSPEDFGNLPTSDVVQLLLEPEGVLTIRPSGTEPKVKLYASLRHPDDPVTLEELQIKKEELQKELISVTGIFFARTGLTG